MSPLAKGLFQRAIAESAPLWDRGLHCADTVSLNDGEKTGEQFTASLGCDKASDSLAAMRAKTPDELLKAWKFTPAQLALPEGIQFLPVVDGWFLPDKPEALFAAGKQQDVPVESVFGLAWNTQKECSASAECAPVLFGFSGMRTRSLRLQQG